jgi:signal transduction histidine kinase
MTDRPLRMAATVIAAGAVAMGVFAIAVGIPDHGFTPTDLASQLTAITFGLLAALIAAQRPRHPIAWVLLFVAFTQGVVESAGTYGFHTTVAHPGVWPGGHVAAWLGSFMWMPGLGVLATVLLLLFPTGRLPSRRWLLVAVPAVWWIAVLATAAAISGWSNPGQFHTNSGPPAGAAGVVFRVGLLCLAACMVASVASLFVRYRRAPSDERQQLKWVLGGTVLLVIAIDTSFQPPIPVVAQAILIFIGIVSFPASITIAVLRYRLYGIDVVINRALVYGSLAVLITGVYVGIAVGIGELVGSGGKPNLGLSILATAIVAVGFQPVRERLQRIANRLVYGKRATPYQVLSEFSSHVAGSYAADEVLPRMARVLHEGTGAERTVVWLRAGGELHPAAAWPDGALATMPRAVPVNGVLPELPDATRSVAVHHQGELLGALSVEKRRGESLTPVEEKLLDDLAHQAGLVLKNVGLTADLQRRLEELRASRQRLVSAQDAERRRLERNLHDGAQQHLVALKVKLGLAEMLTARDPEKAKATIAQLKSDTDEALETLRDLARGIYPPLLAEKGLATALESQARKAALPVIVDAAGIDRYPQELEATVYFCVLEALQNVQKYASASHVVVRLRENAGELTFEVIDDGHGFDVEHAKKGAGLTNMQDRLDAIGGALSLTSTATSGTRVAGTVPTPAVVPA